MPKHYKNILLIVVISPAVVGGCLSALWSALVAPDFSNWLFLAGRLLYSLSGVIVGVTLLINPRLVINWLKDTFLSGYANRVKITTNTLLNFHLLGAIMVSVFGTIIFEILRQVF